MILKDNNLINFSDLADSKAFKEFFEIAHELTGFHIVLVDPAMTNLKFLYNKEEVNPICNMIQSDPKGKLRCLKIDRDNFIRAAKCEKGIHYLCHAGLVDMAVPIFVEGNHIATISCGQVLPEKPSEEGFIKFKTLNEPFNIEPEILKELYFKCPYIEKNKLEEVLKLFSFFADYFCEVGVKLKIDTKTSEREEIQTVKKYMQQHFREPVNLKEIAYHVSLSPAYLSSIFNKTTGMHLSYYLQKLRIEEVKKLLKETNFSITKIAFEVGFNNLTHFSRTFKKLEGKSPKSFRETENK